MRHVRKWLILSHRYLGIALCVLLVMWFASGIVMIYAGGLPSLTPEAREKVIQYLAGWRQDPDLAGLRDPAKLDELPPPEREECRTLWKQLEATLVRATAS